MNRMYMQQVNKKDQAPRVTKEEAEKLAEQHAEEQAAVDAAREKELDLADTDDLLDEIDGLLEEQEVLTHYRQQGGE